MPELRSTKALRVKGAITKLSSEKTALRIQGANALGRLREAGEPAVSALADLLGDKNTKVAEAAAAALRDIGPAARAASA